MERNILSIVWAALFAAYSLATLPLLVWTLASLLGD
jgi:hypothetical protein